MNHAHNIPQPEKQKIVNNNVCMLKQLCWVCHIKSDNNNEDNNIRVAALLIIYEYLTITNAK